MKPDIYLVSIEDGHVRKTFDWIKDPDLRRLFLMRGDATWEDHKAYFNKLLKDPCQRVYAIMVDGKHAGNCGIKNISQDAREGELWIYVGESSFRHKGIGSGALRILLYKGFDVLSLKKIYVHFADFNIAAQKLYKKFGFVEARILQKTSEWSNRGCKIIYMEANSDRWMSR